MKRFLLPILLALLPLQIFAKGGIGNDIEVYMIGNSLFRQLSIDRLAWLFEQSGGRLGYGHQGAADCPMHNQWTLERNGKPLRTGNEETQPYGNYPNALTTAKFDALILQPYQNWLESDPGKPDSVPGDLDVVSKFIDYARGNNPAKNAATNTFYLFGGWPELLGIHYRNPATTTAFTPGSSFGNSFTGFTFADFYASPYTRDVLWNQTRQTVATRDFLNKLAAAVNDRHKDLPQPVRLIPNGDVLSALDKKIREGTLPGIEAYFTRESNAAYYVKSRAIEKSFPLPPETPFDAKYGIVNFYTDRFHFTGLPHNSVNDGAIGGYVTSLVVYTTLTGKNPIGLPVTRDGKGWQQFDPVADANLVRALQETVWEIVSNDSLTGVTP